MPKTTLISRISKTSLLFALAVYYSLVVVNNTTDYASNFEFVKHVMTMDTTFQNSAVSWRAVGSETAHHIAYIAIIIAEAVIAAILWIGAVRCTASLKKTKAEYALPKAIGEMGLSLGVLLFFMVFLNIAGEWFLMWQSKIWSAQATTFAMIGIQMLILIYSKMPEGDSA